MLAGVGDVPGRSRPLQRGERSTPSSHVRDKLEWWRLVFLYDAHVVCVVCPQARGGTPNTRFLPSVRLPDALGASKAKLRGSSAVVNSCREWARDRLMLIGTKLGNRLKNSVLRMYLLRW